MNEKRPVIATTQQCNDATTRRCDNTTTGQVYDRDPYETDTDQSIDGGDSDLDEDGNIIQGPRPLTPEEYMAYLREMGKSKERNQEADEDDIYAIGLENDKQVQNRKDNIETWLADTGASCHVTSSDGGMMNEVKGGNDKVIVGDQRKCKVDKKGTLHLETIDTETCITSCRRGRPSLATFGHTRSKPKPPMGGLD